MTVQTCSFCGVHGEKMHLGNKFPFVNKLICNDAIACNERYEEREHIRELASQEKETVNDLLYGDR